MRHSLQPDQDPALWGRHVAAYEAVFEPLSNQFATLALEASTTLEGCRLIDVGAGAGGAALMAAQRGAEVLAIDASAAMVDRINVRAQATGLASRLLAEVMDARALRLPDESFDLALSCFGVILLPDPVAGLRELRRVLRPDGGLVLVTWTEPDAYELAARLRSAALEVCGATSVSRDAPVQLRYADPEALGDLVTAGGFTQPRIERLEGRLVASSAEHLAARLDFAPGLASLLAGFGPRRADVIDAFVARLLADQGPGTVSLGAVAQVALASRT